MASMLETNWKLRVESVKWAANSLIYGVFPELAERAKREAEELGKLPPPQDSTELALMIAKPACYCPSAKVS